MRSFCSILSVFFALIAPTQYAYSSDPTNWDTTSDEQIKSCLSSDTFQNISLPYSYDHRNWKLRIIFNPNYEKIELGRGQPSMFQFYYGVFSEDIIPENLQSHLKVIIESQLNSSAGGYWSISSTINGNLAIDYFADATAVYGTGRSETQNEFSKDMPEEKYTDLDQEIHDLFKNKKFKKLSLNYPWQGNSYSIHFVYNPRKEFIFCSEFSNPVQWPFAMTIDASSYPLSLAQHIKKCIPENLLKDPDSVIDIADWKYYSAKNSPSVYKTLHPISVLTRLENPDVDAEIKSLLHSTQLNTKSLHYELNGDFYSVFLIYNPEQLNLKSTLSFNTWGSGQLSHTATWSSKIGIFVNKKAPQELIDHITQLYELSWWDTYWNLSVHNGDKVSIFYSRHPWQETYTPYSWYTFMVNAEP